MFISVESAAVQIMAEVI